MAAVFDAQALSPGKLHVALVYERRGVEQRAALVDRQPLSCDATQVGIERLEQTGERLDVAALRRAQQSRDVVHDER